MEQVVLTGKVLNGHVGGSGEVGTSQTNTDGNSSGSVNGQQELSGRGVIDTRQKEVLGGGGAVLGGNDGGQSNEGSGGGGDGGPTLQAELDDLRVLTKVELHVDATDVGTSGSDSPVINGANVSVDDVQVLGSNAVILDVSGVTNTIVEDARGETVVGWYSDRHYYSM